MSTPQSMLITSEMMQQGKTPLLFTGGACNIQLPSGPIRNPGRDELADWLDEQGWTYFDPQIHPSTHGRDYIWEIDGPTEKEARLKAKLRIYEITATTIGAVSMMEILDDAWRGRFSIVWFNEGQNFAPVGLGTYGDLKNNRTLRAEVGDLAYSHLLAYVNAGRHIRNEIVTMLADCPTVIFVDSFKALTAATRHMMQKAVPSKM